MIALPKPLRTGYQGVRQHEEKGASDRQPPPWDEVWELQPLPEVIPSLKPQGSDGLRAANELAVGAKRRAPLYSKGQFQDEVKHADARPSSKRIPFIYLKRGERP